MANREQLGTVPRAGENPTGVAVLERLSALALCNDQFAAELRRCHQQLDSIFQLTSSFSSQPSASQIEETLVDRIVALIHPSVLLAFGPDGAEQLFADDSATSLPPMDEVSRSLDVFIQRAKLIGDTHCPNLDAQVAKSLGGASVMLGSLRNLDDVVVLAAFRPNGGEFTRDELMTVETALVYGGHVLRNAVLMQRERSHTLEAVTALANAVEARDPYTRGHSDRVGWLARLTASELALPIAAQRSLEWAGILHDIGKIAIPEAILTKPGALTADEYEIVKHHPRVGYDVLKPISSLEPILDAVLHHHENVDGSGYPDGLSGDQISLNARILRVVDFFDAITSQRSYRSGVGMEGAFELIDRGVDRETDAEIFHAFRSALRGVEKEHPDLLRVHLSSMPRSNVAITGPQNSFTAFEFGPGD